MCHDVLFWTTALLPYIITALLPLHSKVPHTIFYQPNKILDKNWALWYDLSVMVNRVNNNEAASEVYILHFERAYWNRARHYVGYTTKTAEERISIHRSGRGSLLVNYALNKKGIDFVVGLIENYATRKLARWREKQLKHEGHLARHCKICQGRS